MEDDREDYIKSLSHNTYTLSNMDGSPVDCEEALLTHKQKIGDYTFIFLIKKD